jgi:hypothetical protein
MTEMSQNEIFYLPNVNDLHAIEAHKGAVLAAFDAILCSIDEALRDALPKALNFFGLLDGKVDLAVHAPITRFIVKKSLAKRSTTAEDEDEVEFHLQKVSNCGLCVQTPLGAVRILKATQDGLPKALSEARVRFSSNNQLVLEFSPDDKPEEVMSLNLFVLWTMDRNYQYTGMEIACPRRTDKEGTIDCFWITKWHSDIQALPSTSAPSLSPDLDEIKPIPAKDKLAEKA